MKKNAFKRKMRRILESHTYDGTDGYTLLLMQRAEVMSYKAQKLFDWLITQTKVSMYRSPGNTSGQREFNHIPLNDRNKLREPYKSLSKDDRLF